MTQQAMTSGHKVGDIAYFQPVLSRIDSLSGVADDTAIPCKIMAVSFTAGKVLYDLAIPDGEGGFYEVYPICRVDSFLVLKPPKE